MDLYVMKCRVNDPFACLGTFGFVWMFLALFWSESFETHIWICIIMNLIGFVWSMIRYIPYSKCRDQMLADYNAAWSLQRLPDEEFIAYCTRKNRAKDQLIEKYGPDYRKCLRD